MVILFIETHSFSVVVVVVVCFVFQEYPAFFSINNFTQCIQYCIVNYCSIYDKTMMLLKFAISDFQPCSARMGPLDGAGFGPF